MSLRLHRTKWYDDAAGLFSDNPLKRNAQFMQMTSDRFFVVAGMHRSHTSLFGRMLADAGVQFHRDLVGANSANPYGHYEDVDFLRIQRAILADNGARWFRATHRTLRISPERKAELEATVKARQAELGEGWAFKVPDNTLFLDYWSSWPEARFLFVFREPLAVLSSMYRRMGKLFFLRPDALWSMAQAYADYNEAILDFIQREPGRSYLIDSKHLTVAPGIVLADAREKIGLPISEGWTGEHMIDRKIVSGRSHSAEKLFSRLMGKRARLQSVHARLQSRADSAGAIVP